MNKKTIMIIAALSLLAPLFYSVYTGQAWEDFLITFRYSQNLIDGNGLVYNIGERTHGFTSPLGMLVLALCYLVTGKGGYLPALWFFRALSFLAYCASCIFLFRSFNAEDKVKMSAAPILCAMAYIFEAKSVAFTANGMETGFMLFFLAWFIFILRTGLFKNWISAGICWAGLMWTRPDSCVYIAAIATAYLFFSRGQRKKIAVAFLKASLLCAVVYLPWVIWASSYYGSPVPHTIWAKFHYPAWQFNLANRSLIIMEYIFGPVYYLSLQSTWPLWMELLSLLLGAFAFTYWMFGAQDKFGRMLSLAFCAVCFYFLFMKRVFPWYFPPLAMFTLIIFVRGIFTLFGGTYRPLPIVILSLILCAMVYIFFFNAAYMRIEQKEVEEGNRKQIGLWLRENVRVDNTVYLEPLGYIGYFSRARMMDYPGLVSERVAQLLSQDKALDFYTLIPKLEPDWVVLRDREADIAQGFEYFRDNYRRVKSFDITSNLNKYKSIPGKEFILNDASYIVFKRQ